MTHKLYINAYFIIFGRPSRSSDLVPRLAVVGVVLLAILADHSSRKQKYLDYDVAPADGVEPPQRPCRAQERDYLSSDSSICPNMSLSCRSRKKVVAHSLFSSSWNVRICSSRDILSSSYANVPFLMPSIIVLYSRRQLAFVVAHVP